MLGIPLILKINCYQTELGSPRPRHSKANLLIPSCGEGKYSIYCRAPSKGVGDKPQVHSNLVFELRVFKGGDQ